jgi:hypothetical protein
VVETLHLLRYSVIGCTDTTYSMLLPSILSAYLLAGTIRSDLQAFLLGEFRLHPFRAKTPAFADASKRFRKQ